MPAVCRFYLKGNCRYGSNCKFEHPGENDYYEDEVDPAYSRQQNQYQQSSTPSSGGFSFAKALNQISSTPAQASSPSSGGFSFIKTLQQTSPQVPQPHLSSHFNSGGFSFTQAIQAHSPPQQNPFNNFTHNFSTNSFNQQSNNSFSSFNNSNTFNNFSSPTPAFNSFNNSIPEVPMQDNLTTNQQQKVQQQLDIDLVREEILAFEAVKFEFRRIPIRAPPKIYH